LNLLDKMVGFFWFARKVGNQFVNLAAPIKQGPKDWKIFGLP
jgi:hypothetical protein